MYALNIKVVLQFLLHINYVLCICFFQTFLCVLFNRITRIKSIKNWVHVDKVRRCKKTTLIAPEILYAWTCNLNLPPLCKHATWTSVKEKTSTWDTSEARSTLWPARHMMSIKYFFLNTHKKTTKRTSG